ncbi:hypothetical protein F4779DRAFT_589642 [Xylariaceae sp. FL0662B]|nr:hypothetical protein F4779DRAFT_589642 [Xylariaceae sp. FL0662B]
MHVVYIANRSPWYLVSNYRAKELSHATLLYLRDADDFEAEIWIAPVYPLPIIFVTSYLLYLGIYLALLHNVRSELLCAEARCKRHKRRLTSRICGLCMVFWSTGIALQPWEAESSGEELTLDTCLITNTVDQKWKPNYIHAFFVLFLYVRLADWP